MMKRRNKPGTVEPKSKWPKRVMTVILASTCSAVLIPYSDSVTSVVKALSASLWAKGQDILSPMSDDKILGVNLRFYLPQQSGQHHSMEDLSATIWPSQCKVPGGNTVIRTFADYNANTNTSTQAIVSIACRTSGRVKVMLTPQSGEQQVIYDGIPDDGERHSYPGISGSYSAGILTIYWLDNKESEGSWGSVNKCQINNSCNDADFARIDSERE